MTEKYKLQQEDTKSMDLSCGTLAKTQAKFAKIFYEN